ncbi:MAG: glycosyltransferase family 4 protein [Planctomycetota bacterium]
MRIDFVITELHTGGAESCLTEVALGLQARGDQVRCFSIGSLPPVGRDALVRRLRDAQVPIETAGADRITQVFSAQRKLTRWLRDNRADVVQSFLFHANVLSSRAARRANIPTHVGNLRVAENKPLRILIERHAASKMQSLVCVSREVERFAKTHLCRPRRHPHGTRQHSRATVGNDPHTHVQMWPPTTVVPNGIDASRFDQATPVDWTHLGWAPDDPVVLFVGRMHPQKNLQWLLETIPDWIGPRHPRRRLLMIGDGPLAGAIDAYCRGFGGDYVRRLPFQQDIAPWMRAASALLLPSRYEGMPNVVLEAMACGLPVICSRVEGIAELTDGASIDMTFAVDDAAAMIDRINQLLANESVAAMIANENRCRVQQRFTWPGVVEAYRKLYQVLTSG